MKTLLILLLVCPLLTWAQVDLSAPVRSEDLKPIQSDLVPGYYGGRYGRSVRTQYTYDGLDIKPKALGQYILASGDPDAIREFNAYVSGRHAGGWLIGGGVATMIVGVAIMGSNGPNSDGKFTTQQPYVCPMGQVCGGSLGTVYGGQVAGYQTVYDTKRANANVAGGVTLLVGAIATGIGWGMQYPGQHARRAVQYYNRSLNQRGISWQLTPYSNLSNSGIGLVGRF